MSSKSSNSLRCRQCGMINWATDENCRRCHQLLARPSAATGAGVSSNRLYLYLIIFIAGAVLPVLVEKASPTTGDDLALFFVMAAVGLIGASSLMLLFEMFKTSLLWGLAGLLFAPVSTLLYVVMYWQRAKGKILTMFAATAYCVIMIAGVGLLLKPKVVQNTTAAQSAPSTKYPEPAPAPKSSFPEPLKNEPKQKIPNKRSGTAPL